MDKSRGFRGVISMKKPFNTDYVNILFIVSCLLFRISLTTFPNNHFFTLIGECFAIFAFLWFWAFIAKTFKMYFSTFEGALLAKDDASIALIEYKVHFCGTQSKQIKLISVPQKTLEIARQGDVIAGTVIKHPLRSMAQLIESRRKPLIE